MEGKKIMVVDDDRDMVFLVKTLLEKEGFEIFSASNGKECIDSLEKVKPDLLILDIIMPKKIGIDVVVDVKKNPKTRGIKIMFMSSLSPEDAENYVFNKFKAFYTKRAAVDYIKKPFSNEDFVKRVKEALSK